MATSYQVYNQLQPNNALSRVFEGFDQGQQAQATAMQLEDAKTARRNKLMINDSIKRATSVDGKTDRNALFVDLASQGLGSEIPGLQKTFIDLDKSSADFRKSKIEGASAGAELFARVISGVKDQAGYDRARQFLALNDIEDLDVMPETFDPAWAAEASRRALSAKDTMPKIETRDFGSDIRTTAIDPLTGQPISQTVLGEKGLTPADRQPKIVTRDLGGTVETVALDPTTGLPIGPASSQQKTLTPSDTLPKFVTRDLGNVVETVAIDPRTGRPIGAPQRQAKGMSPGEIATDKRVRDQIAQGKVPSGYRQNADGSLSYIPGGPADPKNKQSAAGKLTEGERTAGFLLRRIENASAELERIEKKSPNAASPEMLPSAVGVIPDFLGGNVASNALTSAPRQQVEAAQEDLLDAALTLGTGAAYTKEQLRGYRKAYFPAIGDDPATISAKRKRLNQLIEAGRVKAGGAATPAPLAAQQQGFADAMSQIPGVEVAPIVVDY